MIQLFTVLRYANKKEIVNNNDDNNNNNNNTPIDTQSHTFRTSKNNY